MRDQTLGATMSKLLILLYGIVAYFIGVAGLICIIAALAGFIPYGFLLSDPLIGIHPIVWNLFLVSLWGIIHTVMARPGFKTIITRVIPVSAERSTYVLVAGLTSIGLIGYWFTAQGMVWDLEATIAVYIIWAIFVFGWVFLLAATFAINHFDLFGLRQVFLNFKNQPLPPLRFVKRAMYKYIRHPIQTGVLIGVWATPTMSMTQITLSLGFTIYIFIGLWFEERDLIKEHGEDYLSYRRSAGKVFPKFGAN